MAEKKNFRHGFEEKKKKKFFVKKFNKPRLSKSLLNLSQMVEDLFASYGGENVQVLKFIVQHFLLDVVNFSYKTLK